MGVEAYMDVELVENVEVLYGGLDHIGETLGDFLDSIGVSKDDVTMEEANAMLIECGICPLF